MRRFLLGWVLALGLVMPGWAAAQTKGEVESVGFNNYYRPNCWTPMVVRIRPEKSGTFQLQVVQEDLDKDRPIFTRTISLTGKDEGGGEQRFWMYFIPQPTNRGLMDVTQGGTLRDLQAQVKVFLCTDAPEGQLGKQLTQLPITSTVTSLEPRAQNQFAAPRGTKLVLAVSDGRTGSQPTWREYETALGLTESVTMVLLRPGELPETALAYESVDAIVWLNADPPDPSKPTEERRMRALQQFVRSGRSLVICQTPERDRTRPWRDMLPVTVTDVVEKADPEPLRAMALKDELPPPTRMQQQRQTADARQLGDNAPTTPIVDRRAPWLNLPGPFRMARAEAKPGTVVDEWIVWDRDAGDRTPYIVRQPYGAGCVTWVAHDLGDPTLTRAKFGWPRVWDRVFDWKNQTVIVHNYTPSNLRDPWERGPIMDIGTSFNAGMDLQAKSRAFVGLAVVFFVVYWLAAGPGLYLYLAAKARAQLSWFLFAFAGVAATVVTVLVVQLLVRGDPELQHVTIIRQAPDQPAIAHTRFGLYIPRDGSQDIALRDAAPGSASFVTAYAIHPEHLTDEIKFPANLEYAVPVREAADTADADAAPPVRITVPYRSTLKKFEARWVGNLSGGVSGSGALVPNSGTMHNATGLITNGTGETLRNVYIAFHGLGYDFVLYRPTWDPGTSLDLQKDFGRTAKMVVGEGEATNQMSGVPGRGDSLYGRIMMDNEWTRYWFPALQNVSFNQQTYSDWGQSVMRSYPMLSLFDRLPPIKNKTGPQGNINRVEILRRGARWMDVSAALSAGQMVVLAESNTNTAPLPIPLEVEGDRIAGRGKVFYQFVLPFDRTAAAAAEAADYAAEVQAAAGTTTATQPATVPAPGAAPPPVENP
jgi:hypothetical protein